MTKDKNTDVLADMTRKVDTRIGQFNVRPVQMKNLKRFALLAVPMFNQVLEVTSGAGNIAQLIDRHESSVVELLELCSDFNADHYNDDNLYPDDFTALVIALVEVNMDFFIQMMLPKLNHEAGNLADRLNQAMSKIGPAASKPLSATDTATKASKSTA